MMSEKYILVRVYKDVEVKDDDDYRENAIELATADLGGFDTEIADWFDVDEHGIRIEEEDDESYSL